MSKKAIVKPSKPALLVGMIVTFLFFLFGLFFMSLLMSEPDSHIGIGFLIFWEIVIIIIFVSYLRNYINYENDSASILSTEIVMEDLFLKSNVPFSFDEKLRKLDSLKKEKIISEEEYNQKRKEIMEEKW